MTLMAVNHLQDQVPPWMMRCHNMMRWYVVLSTNMHHLKATPLPCTLQLSGLLMRSGLNIETSLGQVLVLVE